MFVAMQAVQVGQRALITDNRTPLQQSEANAWAGRHVNFSGTLGYLVAYLDLPRRFRGYGHGNTVFTHTSTPTLAYLAITIAVACYCNPERARKTPNPVLPSHMTTTTTRTIRNILFGPPSQIRIICLVQFLSWLGWFPFLFYTVP
jgi:solute carrier family 45, member 1/2/4